MTAKARGRQLPGEMMHDRESERSPASWRSEEFRNSEVEFVVLWWSAKGRDIEFFVSIVNMYGSFHDPRYIYLLLEYIVGGEFFTRLRKGVEEFTEDVLLQLAGEVQAVRKQLEGVVPGLDLTDAVDLKQWYLDCFAGQMTDTSSLRGCMNTNPGYAGLTHPMKESDGKFVPDLKYRYLTEDVPTGMCFNKGLGEILGVPMPMTDKVLAWAQEFIGMEILVDGKMSGASTSLWVLTTP